MFSLWFKLHIGPQTVFNYPNHIFVPAFSGTLLVGIILILIWLVLYLTLIGALPIPDTIREWLRLNLATLRSVTGLSWFISPMFNRVEERQKIQTLRNQRKDANAIIDDWMKILQEDFGLQINLDDKVRAEIKNKIVEETEQLKIDAYPIISEITLNQYAPETRNGLEAFVFAREIERLREEESRTDFTGEQPSEYTQGVRNALDIFDFMDPAKEEKMFLLLYDKLSKAIKNGIAVESSSIDAIELAIQPTPSQKELIQKYQEFMREYYPSESWPMFGHDEYIKYKNKIVELVQQQISIGGIQGDIFGILKKERERILDQLEAQEAYLVCSKQIENYDGNFHHKTLPDRYHRSIRIGSKYLEEPNKEEEPLEIKMRIVFPQKSYGSSSNFMSNSLSAVVPEEELVYVSKLSMPFESRRSEDEIYEIANEDENVDYVLSETDFLLKGRSEEDVTRAAIDNLRMSEMDVAELLKSLTLRSVVEFATYEEEEFFSRRRSDLEDGLEIADIFEWGEQDPEVVGELLDRWDGEEVSDRWEKIATQYISEIQKATPPEYLDERVAEPE